MGRLLTYLMAIMGLVGFILFALSQYNDSAAKRMYAQTAVIQANSSARQDLLAAMLPYSIIALGLIGMVIMTGLIIYGLTSLNRQQINSQSVKLIETRIIVMPMLADNVSNRRIYKQLSAKLGDE